MYCPTTPPWPIGEAGWSSDRHAPTPASATSSSMLRVVLPACAVAAIIGGLHFHPGPGPPDCHGGISCKVLVAADLYPCHCTGSAAGRPRFGPRRSTKRGSWLRLSFPLGPSSRCPRGPFCLYSRQPTQVSFSPRRTSWGPPCQCVTMSPGSPTTISACLRKVHFDLLLDKLGSAPATVDGTPGTHFAVWAPNAKAVSVVGDFNGWELEHHPMAVRHDARASTNASFRAWAKGRITNTTSPSGVRLPRCRQGLSLRLVLGNLAQHRFHRLGSRPRLAGCRLDGRAQGKRLCRPSPSTRST